MSSPSATLVTRPSGSGLGYMIQAAFWFAVMALLVKLAGKTGLPTMQIVLVRACVTLTLSSFTLWHARIPPFGNNTRLLLLRGLFGSGGLMCFYAAINHLPLAEATVIHQISPVLTAVVAAIWIGEKLETRVMLGMALVLKVAFVLVLWRTVEQSDSPKQQTTKATAAPSPFAPLAVSSLLRPTRRGPDGLLSPDCCGRTTTTAARARPRQASPRVQPSARWPRAACAPRSSPTRASRRCPCP